MDALRKKAIVDRAKALLKKTSAERYAVKHDGPGPHDNGSPQSVHAGHSPEQSKKMLERRAEVLARVEQIKQDSKDNPTNYESKTDQEILDLRETFYRKMHRMEAHGLNSLTPEETELYNKDKARWDRLGLEMNRRRETYARERQLTQIDQSLQTGIITVSESEMAQLLAKPGDAYRDANYAGEYNPDIMLTSDLSGMRIRNYIRLPDGRLAHPDELLEARRRGRVIVVEDIAGRITK